MTTVVGEGELRPVTLENAGPGNARWLPFPMVGGSVPFDAGGLWPTWEDGWWGGGYAAVYAAQPEVRICVDFLARNIGQLGTKVLRRIAADDREDLYDHGLATSLRNPSPATTAYQWRHGLVADLAIFDETVSLIIDVPDEERIVLQRVPVPALVPDPTSLVGGEPQRFILRLGGKETPVRASDVFRVHGYNPGRLTRGLAPLDTLARLLAEASAAQAERTRFWMNKASVGGVIERPLDAPKWSDPAAERFKEDWAARFAGPQNAGKTPVLEDGMTFKPETLSPAESQWAEGRRLTREEVARAFHIPPPMVGILDHATFSNISEQHRMLYQDTLGPWLELLTGEFERQLLPRFADREGVYVEFNVAGKLQGSFAEQAAALASAIGRPYLTGNEGRGLMNLPRVDTPDMDEVVLPLNVTTTGPGSAPPDQEPQEPPAVPPVPEAPVIAASLDRLALVAPRVKATRRWTSGVGRMRDRHATAYEGALRRHFERQEAALAADPRTSTGRWDRELAKALNGLHGLTAEDLGNLVAQRFDVEWEPERMARYLSTASRIDAEGINATTETRVKSLVETDPDLGLVDAFKQATGYRVALLGSTFATQYGSFGQTEAAKQGGLGTKVWTVTNPKSRHPQLDGEAVEVGGTFSNGAAYPGDPAADSDETSGCQCLMDFEA